MTSYIDSVLKFHGAQELREALGNYIKTSEFFQKHTSIIVDLADVTDVDLTLLQLIESARITAAREGKTLSLSAPASGALLVALERGGFLGEPTDPRTQFWLAA